MVTIYLFGFPPTYCWCCHVVNSFKSIGLLGSLDRFIMPSHNMLFSLDAFDTSHEGCIAAPLKLGSRLKLPCCKWREEEIWESFIINTTKAVTCGDSDINTCYLTFIACINLHKWTLKLYTARNLYMQNSPNTDVHDILIYSRIRLTLKEHRL